MKLIEVTHPSLENRFLELSRQLYAGEHSYIQPLDKDIRLVFDPEKNKRFKDGEAIRWILEDDQGLLIGRVAAFTSKSMARAHDQPTGGMGFFECIDKQDAADILFDAAKEWLQERGMEAMDGPINFGDRNNWWGLLVDGFYEPNYQMPYNYPYYQKLFENYGFKTLFKQYTYKRPMGGEVGIDEKMYERGELTLADPDYTFRHLTRAEYAKLPEYFLEVYNKAWVGHKGVKPMSKLQAEATFKQMKPIADMKLIWFAFYKGKPIAFFISMPELNQLFKHLNGKWNIWSKLKLYYLLKTNACKKALGIVFGVVPEHQRKGVESALVIAYTKMAWKKNFQYNDFEMNWIGDFNPKMMRVVEQIGGKLHKTHITYRLLFNKTNEEQKKNE